MTDRLPGEGERGWRLFGFTLDRKVNLLALAAFLLSSLSLGIQAWQYAEGADVSLRLGERVNLLFRSHPADPAVPFLLVNARLSYANAGAVGRDAIVVDERLEIRFGEEAPYEYRWLHFELLLPDAAGRARAEVRDSAHAVVVPGAGAESHQTTFYGQRDAPPDNPEARANPVTLPAFESLTRGLDAIALRFLAEDAEGRRYEASCRLVLTPEIRSALAATGWATALCD